MTRTLVDVDDDADLDRDHLVLLYRAEREKLPREQWALVSLPSKAGRLLDEDHIPVPGQQIPGRPLSECNACGFSVWVREGQHWPTVPELVPVHGWLTGQAGR